MFKYYYVATVNPVKLSKEISSEFPLISMSTSGTSLVVYSQVELNSDQKYELDIIIASHTTTDVHAFVKDRIIRAMEFGNDILAEYATKRVLRGATVEDTASVLSKLSQIQTSLISGSLYVALDQLSNFTPDAEIPQEDIDDFIQRISVYLGL